MAFTCTQSTQLYTSLVVYCSVTAWHQRVSHVQLSWNLVCYGVGLRAHLGTMLTAYVCFMVPSVPLLSILMSIDPSNYCITISVS